LHQTIITTVSTRQPVTRILTLPKPYILTTQPIQTISPHGQHVYISTFSSRHSPHKPHSTDPNIPPSPTPSEQPTITGQTNRYYLHSHTSLLNKALEKLDGAIQESTKKKDAFQISIGAFGKMIVALVGKLQELDKSVREMNEFKENIISKLAWVECLLEGSTQELLDSEASVELVKEWEELLVFQKELEEL
jgi:hypothetical protein